jgi:RNA polymerase sigma-70 factor (ECF subfamily)
MATDASGCVVQSDASLIEASRTDPGSFAAVFERHFVAVHRYLTRRVGVQLADDLAAETFATALRARHGYDQTWPDARPWLFGIATRLVQAHWRTEGRRLSAIARLEIESPPDGVGDLGVTRAEAESTRPRLADALLSLGPHQRDVILLAAWADLSFDEIGHALGIPPGTVRSRLYRARVTLRARLVDLHGFIEGGD